MKVAPFDEIFANPSDLKHVEELMGCSDGLGVVIAFGLRHLYVFYARFQTGQSGMRRRLVLKVPTVGTNHDAATNVGTLSTT